MNPETTNDNLRLSNESVQRAYEAHGQSLQRFLRGLLRDEAAAADAFQATLGKLIEKGHTANQASIKSWLFQVAYNEAMMLRRKSKTIRQLAHQAAWLGQQKTEQHQITGLEATIRTETIARVQAAIEQLSAEQQLILKKRIYEGIKFKDIAEQLELPLGTVLSRMHAATKQLKTSLISENENDE